MKRKRFTHGGLTGLGADTQQQDAATWRLLPIGRRQC